MAGSLAAGLLQEPTVRYRIIDPHVHVWKNDPRYPWAKETTRPPEKDATPEMLIGLMKANGVEKTVIVHVIYYRWDNSYTADVLKQYPQYFQGVARVNPEGISERRTGVLDNLASSGGSATTFSLSDVTDFSLSAPSGC